MSLMSLTAVTAFDAAGPVLLVGFFVIPPATAYLLTDRLSRMVCLGVLIAIAGVFVGTSMATMLDTPIAGTVASTMGLGFVVVLVVSPRHGLLMQWQHRVQNRRDFFDTMLAIHLFNHQGTSDETAECSLVNLPVHLNWAERDTRTVVARMLSRGWGVVRGELLGLTPLGREVARSAIGLRSTLSPESVS